MVMVSSNRELPRWEIRRQPGFMAAPYFFGAAGRGAEVVTRKVLSLA
jgi:hypothetical protein